MTARPRPRSTADRAFKVDMGTWYFAPGDLEADRQLIELFRRFKYDIKNQQHWRWLVQELTARYFHIGKGRPPKWTKAAYKKLLADLFWLDRKLHIDPSGTAHLSRERLASATRERAALLKKKHALDPLYRNSSVDEIYKNLLKAQKAQTLEIYPDAGKRGWLKPKRRRRAAKK